VRPLPGTGGIGAVSRYFIVGDAGFILTEAGFEVETASGAGFPFFNLHRVVVILLASGAMAAFRPLFRLNRLRGGRGWETVAVARGDGVEASARG
jgi:hypothetical protein